MSQDVYDAESCFCCGSKNKRGLHLKFTYPKENEAETILTLPDYFSGWQDIVHGGFISMLLDEAMAHSCVGLLEKGKLAVTAELNIQFKKPLKIKEEVIIKASVIQVKSRIMRTEGEILGLDGEIYAKGKAAFLLTN
jgi:uncharacterized protein (TIGR00369 family)